MKTTEMIAQNAVKETASSDWGKISSETPVFERNEFCYCSFSRILVNTFAEE